MPLLKQHKQIYQILEEEMKHEIHALALKTRSE
jgi:stress-induced morphogen